MKKKRQNCFFLHMVVFLIFFNLMLNFTIFLLQAFRVTEMLADFVDLFDLVLDSLLNPTILTFNRLKVLLRVITKGFEPYGFKNKLLFLEFEETKVSCRKLDNLDNVLVGILLFELFCSL